MSAFPLTRSITVTPAAPKTGLKENESRAPIRLSHQTIKWAFTPPARPHCTWLVLDHGPRAKREGAGRQDL